MNEDGEINSIRESSSNLSLGLFLSQRFWSNINNLLGLLVLLNECDRDLILLLLCIIKSLCWQCNCIWCIQFTHRQWDLLCNMSSCGSDCIEVLSWLSLGNGIKSTWSSCCWSFSLCSFSFTSSSLSFSTLSFSISSPSVLSPILSSILSSLSPVLLSTLSILLAVLSTILTS